MTAQSVANLALFLAVFAGMAAVGEVVIGQMKFAIRNIKGE